MAVRIGVVSATFAALLGLVAAARAEPAEKLGTVSFENTCSAAVQPKLQRAVALLHSFWWSEGTKAFNEVWQDDPGCAIAGWGLAALAIGNPYATGPTPEGAQRAQGAIAKARSIGAKSDRERGYIEAIAAYYDKFSERPHPARLRSLADAFEALAKQYPDDETQIFSAIYVVATQNPADKSFERAMRGAAILEAQYQKHPDHPGVAHYLIHAYDYPSIADKGLAAAMCYAGIAPSAPHALHMPSHIFTRVGMWVESASTNARSIAAATGDAERSDRLHALDYMVYADLQLARDGEAERAVEAVAQPLAGDGAPATASAYSRAAVPARYAIERGKWAEAAKLPDPDASKFPYTDAMRYFARALGAARSGNPDAAAADITHLKQIVETLKAAKNDYWATEVDVQRIASEAWVAYAKGSHDTGLGLMRQAADMEDRSEKHAVSPGRLIPARELLGDMLLESGRPAEALTEYEASQVRDPKRFRGYWGAGQAAAAAGNADKARYHFTRLVEMAGWADPRPELATARAYLAGK